MKDTRERFYRFRANEAETEWIESKFKLSGCKSRSQFFRALLKHGLIVKYDEKLFAEISYLIEKIGGNLNQISAKIKSEHRELSADIAELEKEWEEIWQLQKSIQLQLLKLKP